MSRPNTEVATLSTRPSLLAKVAGVATREVWKFTVTDPALVPREYCVVDEARIRKVVAALKGDTTIPGVRVYAEKSIAAGAA